MSTIKVWSISTATLCVIASVLLMVFSLYLSWDVFTFISILFALCSVTFALFGLIAVLAGKRDS